LDLLRIHGDFYRQRYNVNVTGWFYDLSKLNCQRCDINLIRMCARGVYHQEGLIFIEKTENINVSVVLT